MTRMKTIASLPLVIGLCVLSNGIPSTSKEVVERNAVGDVVSGLAEAAPVTGPPSTKKPMTGYRLHSLKHTCI